LNPSDIKVLPFGRKNKQGLTPNQRMSFAFHLYTLFYPHCGGQADLSKSVFAIAGGVGDRLSYVKFVTVICG
jgi:hypothetical protein